MLNKLTVLDKGFVALVSVSCDGRALKDLEDSYFRTRINKELWHLASMTLLVKCPLFQQLHFSKYNFNIVQLPDDGSDLDVYIPDISEIHTGNTTTDREIQGYLEATSQSLLMASKAMQHDKCNRFVSQVLTPINVYNEIVIHGSLNDWLKYIKLNKLPNQLEAYRSTIEGIMAAEWKQLETYKKGM